MAKVTLTQAVGKMEQSLTALVQVNLELVALMRDRITAPAQTPTTAPTPTAKKAPAHVPKAPKAEAAAKKAPAKKAEEVAHVPIGGWWYFKVGEEIAGGTATPCEISLAQPVPVGRVWVRPVNGEKPGKWRAVEVGRVYNQTGWLKI